MENKVFRGHIFKGIDKICSKDDLRPVMSGAIIDKGNIVATDAHHLIKIDLKFFDLDEDSIKVLENKFLPSDLLLELGRLKPNQEWFVNEQGFNLIKEGKVTRIYPIEESELKYPNYQVVIPEETAPVTSFGLNAQLLLNIQKIYEVYRHLTGSETTLKIKNHGQNRAMVAINKDETFLGLLMPIRVD